MKKIKCNDKQSPININKSETVKSNSTLECLYELEEFEVLDSEYFIEFRSVKKKSYVIFNGTKYVLEQFHFHNKSENYINQKQYAMEGHLVHVSNDRFLVISIMFEIKEYNDIIKSYVNNINSKVKINLSNFNLVGKHFFEFFGSLTTPPYDEGVKWLVFEQPLQISKEQLEAFQKYYKNNNRKIQDVNDRTIYYN